MRSERWIGVRVSNISTLSYVRTMTVQRKQSPSLSLRKTMREVVVHASNVTFTPHGLQTRVWEGLSSLRYLGKQFQMTERHRTVPSIAHLPLIYVRPKKMQFKNIYQFSVNLFFSFLKFDQTYNILKMYYQIHRGTDFHNIYLLFKVINV